MSRSWVIAGGGTGGHFFSGVAIAEAILQRDPQSRVVFVGTANGIEGRTTLRDQFDIRYITVSGIKGKGLGARALAMVRLPMALLQSLSILREIKPACVIGVGGYASGPVLAAAKLIRCRTAVMEQNSVPGLTNKLLSRLVDRVFLGFLEAREHFPAGDMHYVGNPIRLGMVRQLTRDEKSAPEEEGFHLLVFGGSQGAHHINTAMVEAVTQLSPALRDRLVLTHQTGKADEELVRDGYAAAGFEARVMPFIEEMAHEYRQADLIVCRAGALTVAELTICKRPAILVPFPYAIYNHQELNARTLADHGAARLLLDADLTGETLAAEIEALAGDGDALASMAHEAGEMGRPQAGEDVVNQCLELVGESS